jgi:hypothetical protein
MRNSHSSVPITDGE